MGFPRDLRRGWSREAWGWTGHMTATTLEGGAINRYNYTASPGHHVRVHVRTVQYRVRILP